MVKLRQCACLTIRFKNCYHLGKNKIKLKVWSQSYTFKRLKEKEVNCLLQTGLG